jgi:hypothetical protein
MRGFYSIITCSALALLAFTGCNFQKIKATNESLSAEGMGPIPADAVISWSLVKNSIMVNCTTCHGGVTSPDLTGASGVRQNLIKVMDAVSSRGPKPMPPTDKGYKPLSACRIAVLQKWVDLGAPDDSTIKISDLAECKNQPGLEPILPISAMPVTYETLLTKILQPKCLMCHTEKPPVGEEDAADFLFTPYAAIVGDPSMDRQWAAPGAGSRVVKFLTRTDDKRMPPPDAPGAVANPLSQDEVDFIIKWIDAGRPEK